MSLALERNKIFCGDALAVLKQFPDACVQCCITSPPYYALRDYGVIGQIGLEATPAEYIAKLVDVFREVKRVLREDGTCWITIGDSYAGGKRGRADSGDGGKFAGPRIEPRDNPIPVGFKPKDLMMIPARLAIALQDDGWWLRSDIIWHKLTAMPEPVTDRPVSAHEHIFLLAKSERYFYDAEAIREPLKPKTLTTYGTKHRSQGNDALGKVKSDNWGCTIETRQPRRTPDGKIAGANKRNVWSVASQPYPGSHFATFPPKLIEPAVLAGTSPQACEHCGAPWRRQVLKQLTANPGGGQKRASTAVPGNSPIGATSVFRTGMSFVHHTTGWEPTCACPHNTGMGKCIILDPFLGAGTVALVAREQNREFIGIELNEAYVRLAEKRVATVQPVLWGREQS